MTNKNRHTVYLNDDVSAKLIKDAKSQKRSISNLLEVIITDKYTDCEHAWSEIKDYKGPCTAICLTCGLKV